MLDDRRDAGQFLRVAGDDERAGLRIDAHGRALLRLAVGVIAHKRCGEDFGNLQRIGRLELEHSGGGALRADLVELPHDGFNGIELVRLAHDDEAVAARVGCDERVRCLRAEAGLRLFEVERADGRREFDGAGGGEIEEARLARVAARFRRAGAELREDALNVLQVLKLARDDETSGLRVGKNLRVRRVGLGLLLPLLGVKLLHQRLQPQHVRRAADLEGARLASNLIRGHAGLEPGEDVFNHLHLIRARADDELARLAVGNHLGVGGTGLWRVRELVTIKLLRNRHEPRGLGEPTEVERLRLARRTGLRGKRLHNLPNRPRLFLRAKDGEARAARIGVNRRRLAGAPQRLLGVDARHGGQQLGRRRILHLDGVQLACALIGLRVERGDDRLDLREHRRGREHDQSFARRLRRDADQIRHGAPGVLRGEDPQRERGEAVHVLGAHVDDLQLARPARGRAADGRRVNALVVQTLDDVLGVFQIVARTGDDDAVGFAVERDGDAADGLVARVELEHGV